jgi:hypothetical protein
LDLIKLDGSLVWSAAEQGDEAGIIRAICSVVRELGIDVLVDHLASTRDRLLELAGLPGDQILRQYLRDAILGDPCILCDDPDITVQQKNWDSFAGPLGPPKAPLRR